MRKSFYEDLVVETKPIFKEAAAVLKNFESSVKKLEGTVQDYEKQIQELEPQLQSLRDQAGELIEEGHKSTRALSAVAGAEKKHDELKKSKEHIAKTAQEKRDEWVDFQGEMQNKLIVFVERTETYKGFQEQLEKKIDEIRDIAREWHHAEKMLLKSYGVPLPGGRNVKITDEDLKDFGKRWLTGLFD